MESSDGFILELKQIYSFSDASIELLIEKGFREDGERKDFSRLTKILSLPDQLFSERRESRNWLDIMLDRGDSQEITGGRYEKSTNSFRNISSEQALVQGRLKFAVEYAIKLADFIKRFEIDTPLIQRAFSVEEKNKLRSIYKKFRTKDYAAIKIIEDRINQDIVAANTWVAVRGQQLGIDLDHMRRLTHFARTSDDLNANVTGRLYMAALGEWTSTLASLINTIKDKAIDYSNITCVANTHGQKAQLTTLGHVYANLAEQIKLHAEPLLKEKPFRLEGKISGAIGTDVDMMAAFPNANFHQLYKDIVRRNFGLKYVDLGNDQSLSHAELNRMLDTMVNVGLVVKKSATDTWLYASRRLLNKKTKKGESGSSIMPQKTNPFFSESAEALISIMSGMVSPIKDLLTAYREQGDLRRSITTREGFHPIMLSIIAMERMNAEIKNYSPDIIGLETEVYRNGTQFASSAVQMYLRERGISDAYDRLKELTMKPFMTDSEVRNYVGALVGKKRLKREEGNHVFEILMSVVDDEGLLERLYSAKEEKEIKVIVDRMKDVNSNIARRSPLLGNAYSDANEMVRRAGITVNKLKRYKIEKVF